MSGIFAGVAPGTYTITAKNISGCIGLSSIVTVNAINVVEMHVI
jgi:hypothetical protein